MPTLTIQGTISFPLGSEASPPARPFSYTIVYTAKAVNDFVLAGPEVGVDLMPHIADAKAAYVEMLAGEVEISINGSEEPLPLSVDGGQWIYGNPQGGLTSLTATSDANARVRAYIFA